MVRFDEVLPELVRIVETSAQATAIERAAVVRDVRGRVRLVIKPVATAAPDLTALEVALKSALGDWFAPPIWTTTAMDDAGRLGGKAMEMAGPWSPKYQDPVTGQELIPASGRWRRLERRLSKEVWLDQADAEPPWELAPGAPTIVTFFSFKGGVGRTTALASCAWQLARRGHRVAAVDLDLEAPGLGTLFGAQTERGVLDFIVDHFAIGARDLDGLHALAQGLPEADASMLEVFPAGGLEPGYLEKLARLDFAGSRLGDGSERSPVGTALTALLQSIRATLRPDFILLDSRAGLHDLAGLSLHGLAHIDVLVGRASEQAYAGMDLTLQILARRKGAEKLQCVLIHSLAPPVPGSIEAQLEEAAFIKRTYQAFQKYIYTENAPAEDDSEAMHWPIVVRSDNALERFSMIGQVPEPRVFSGGYQDLCEYIVQLSQPT